MGAWEAVALTLARKAGIATPAARLEDVAGKPVLVVTRFDRVKGHRKPFLSAMSMLGAKDNESRSYFEFVDVLRIRLNGRAITRGSQPRGGARRDLTSGERCHFCVLGVLASGSQRSIDEGLLLVVVVVVVILVLGGGFCSHAAPGD